MKKEGFRLSVLHEEYDPNAVDGMSNEINAILGHLVTSKALSTATKTIDVANGKIADGEVAAVVAAARTAHDAHQQTLVVAADA